MEYGWSSSGSNLGNVGNAIIDGVSDLVSGVTRGVKGMIGTVASCFFSFRYDFFRLSVVCVICIMQFDRMMEQRKEEFQEE